MRQALLGKLVNGKPTGCPGHVYVSLFTTLMLPPQTCMDKHQVVGVLRQMEKFLKGQEMRFTEGLRIMKLKLASLQNSVSKMPQADQSAGEE